MLNRNFFTAGVLVVVFAMCSAVWADTGSNEIIFKGRRLEREARLMSLRYCDKNAVISLDNTELYEDDAPATGVPEMYQYNGLEWKEELKKGIVIKKILLINNPGAFSGRIVCKAEELKGNTTPLNISVNGIEFQRPATIYAAPFAKQYTRAAWDRWFYIDMPVGALREGANEILMWADSDSASWRMLIAIEEEFARGSVERSHHPNRSMKSSDGGRSWSDTKLGTTNAVDGEYSIRISLDHYVESGEYLSPVIDVVDEGNLLKQLVRVTKIAYNADVDTPEGTQAAVKIRFGSSPRADDPSWTDWGAVTLGSINTVASNMRYIQWKADLSTSDPLATPALKEFRISAEWENNSPNTLLGLASHVIHNGHVAHASYQFGYEDLKHPGLEKLRKDYKLDKYVAGVTNEFELMMRLLHWSYRIPLTSDQYSWNWNDVPLLVKGEDGMPKLQMDYKGRRRDAMCLYSNQALVGVLLAFGFQARHINIHSEGISGHEVTEVWSNEFNKWIYMDATRDYYYFDLDTGIPLSLLEIHNLLKEQVPRVETWRRPYAIELADQIGPRIRIGMREGNNPVSIVEHGRHLMETMGHFRIIPRNNFLSQPLPVPVHTGATMWGWDGFLNWYDEKFPKRYEYQLQTNRALDFYEPLNQAEVFLMDTDERGVLKVEVDTFTPGGFDTFVVTIDDGKQMEMNESSWLWPLRIGLNSLKVRTRNVRGVLGPESYIKVTYNP